MADWRSFYDRNYVAAFDLEGRDVTMEISSANGAELQNQKGTQKKLVLNFVKASKGFVVNKTNGKAIARMYGNDVANWVGKKITLYPTTTEVGGETVECIRVRPQVPK